MNRVNTKASSQGEKKQGVSVKKRKRKKRGKKKEVGQKYFEALTVGHLNNDVLLADAF